MNANQLAVELNIHPLVAEMLIRRGVGTPAAARGFLDPDYYRPQLPDALPGMRQAAALVGQALAEGRRILVWGDFDVDGQTATALLVQAFTDLAGDSGAQVRYHVPVRASEGHGVNLEWLQRYFEAGDQAPPELIVTCDTGATAFDALAYLQRCGAQVVVTDHHELALGADGLPQLPPAEAVITPRRLPADHPLAGLPGVGVAYKLVEALYEAAGCAQEAETYLDLVALGIVADVAEQTGDTRYLLQLGLRQLRRTVRPGLLAIYERAGLKIETINEEHVGFALGPRLNALGRLGDANPAVELLTTPDMGRARLLALQLEGLNARRQLLTSQTLQAALKQVESDPALLDGAALVLAHPAWEPGIIGIVAGRLAERFGRPAAVIATPTGLPGRGSARSVPGVHITDALAANAALLRSFGGHAGAAGFAVDPENIAALRRGLNRAVAAQRVQALQADATAGAQVFTAPLQPGEALRVDVRLDWESIGPELAEEIERLAPFGPGNPPPALACPDVTVSGQAAVGRAGEHLALRLTGLDGVTRRAMWWGGADFAAQSSLPSMPLEAVITLRTSNGGTQPLTIEWLGYRLPAIVRPGVPALDVRDYRGAAHPLGLLMAWLEEIGPHLVTSSPQSGERAGGKAGVFIWAEGDARRELAERLPNVAVGGRDEIPACQTLVIWTSPPGASELADGLRCAKAQQAVLFAVDAGMDASQAFLERLAGAARSALRVQAAPGAQPDEAGGAPLARLAAVSAQRETAVRLGLKWLEAQGFVQAHVADGRVFLSAGDLAEKDVVRSAEILTRLRELLAETRAFRTFYAHASLDALQLGMPDA